MTAFRPCAVIPTYDNPQTIEAVVDRVRRYVENVIVVDDGSRIKVAELPHFSRAPAGVSVYRRQTNGGKGAAMKDGLRLAAERGFTHALQVDADGQHALEDIPRFLGAAVEEPSAFIVGYPVFDESAPRLRIWARKITIFWVTIETLGRVLVDPLFGFRVYPLARTKELHVSGDYMDFDPEIAVRLVLGGTEVRNLPTRVRYIKAEEGGVSHFQLVRDTARIAWMHVRMVILMIGLVLSGRHRRSG
jgi:glycosyltransferase involved in cell wall biosynthesis